MTEWTFQYEAFIQSIDEFTSEHGDIHFQMAWEYTQKMVTAHGMALGGDNPKDESISIAWSQFEDTFDDDEDGAVISLAGIIANLVAAVPVGKNIEFHRFLEIGFARARGFSREQADLQHDEWLKENTVPEIEIADEYEEVRKQFVLIEGGT